MAFKLALISFEFETFKGLSFDRTHVFDPVESPSPPPNKSIQPVVAAAYECIRECVAKCISSMFIYGWTQIQNVNNSLHIATTIVHAHVPDATGQDGDSNTVLTAKFYRLTPSLRYKVCIDLEHAESTHLDANQPGAFECGLSNDQIEKLHVMLNQRFDLDGQSECLPVLRRGRTLRPHFLITSDERIVEYDFDKVLYHRRSEYQDIKIVSSPSLGNTLLLDNLQNLAEEDLNYTYTIMDRGQVSYKDKEILILGGGDGGLLWELLKEDPKMVVIAEIDAIVIEACRLHMRPFGQLLERLEGENYKFIIGDCMKVLRQSLADGKQYDVIFNDLTDIPVGMYPGSLTAFDPSATQRDNPWHFIESIYNLSLACLKPNGMYMTHTTGKGNVASREAYEQLLQNGHTKVTYDVRYSYVPSFAEIWTFYTIKKRVVE